MEIKRAYGEDGYTGDAEAIVANTRAYFEKYPRGKYWKEIEDRAVSEAVLSKAGLHRYLLLFPSSSRLSEIEERTAEKLRSADPNFSNRSNLANALEFPGQRFYSDVDTALMKIFSSEKFNPNFIGQWKKALADYPAFHSYPSYQKLLHLEFLSIYRELGVWDNQIYNAARLRHGPTIHDRARTFERFLDSHKNIQPIPRDTPCQEFIRMSAIIKAREANTAASYREYISKHGLSHPGRLYAIYRLTVIEQAEIIDVALSHVLNYTHLADSPFWVVYCFCETWPDGPKKKRFAFKVSEEQHGVERVGEIDSLQFASSHPLSRQNNPNSDIVHCVKLLQPIPVHRTAWTFNCKFVDYATDVSLWRFEKHIVSNPDYTPSMLNVVEFNKATGVAVLNMDTSRRPGTMTRDPGAVPDLQKNIPYMVSRAIEFLAPPSPMTKRLLEELSRPDSLGFGGGEIWASATAPVLALPETLLKTGP